MTKKFILSAVGALGLVAVCGGTYFHNADAAQREFNQVGVLKIRIDIQGTENWTRGQEWRKGAIQENHVIEMTLKSAPHLDSVNMLDPNYAQKQLDHAAKVQAHHQKVAARANAAMQRNGGNVRSAPFGMDPMKMAQELQAKCGTDQACMQKNAMQLMANNAKGQDAQVMADIQAMSTDCTNIHGHAMGSSGYDKCMDDLAKKRSTGPVEEDIEDLPEPEDRYLRYAGVGDDWTCTAKSTSLIDRRANGALADVIGLIPGYDFTITTDDTDPSIKMDAIKAVSKEANPTQTSMLCTSQQVVVDVKDNTLYVQSFSPLPVPARNKIHNPPDGPLESTSDTTMYGSNDMFNWMMATLKGAPLEGAATKTFTFSDGGDGGSTQKTTTATIKWAFVEAPKSNPEMILR